MTPSSSAPTSTRPRWPRGQTLRARLTLSLVLVLVIAGVVFGVATGYFLRGFLVSRVDAQLEVVAAERQADSLEDATLDAEEEEAEDAEDDEGDDGDDLDQLAGTLAVVLVDGGIVEAERAGAEEDDDLSDRFSDRDSAMLASLTVGAVSTVRLDLVGDYRLLALEGPDGEVQVTGLPLEDIDATMRELITIEFVLLAVLMLSGGVITAFIVRRTLVPLDEVARTALRVSELPLGDPDTELPTGIAPEHPTTEVDQVSVAFDHMLDHVRSALAARDATEQRLRRFIADASHELRTPLSTVRAYAEYALRADESMSVTTAESLRRIDVAGSSMARLVDDLLLLARLDSGRPLAREPVDLPRLALDAVTDARTVAPDHQWRLDLPELPLEVVGDAERLHQLVSNLLRNAVIHTPAGTTVEVSVRATPYGSDLAVCDSGPGIPADQQAGLFDRFTRGDRSRASTEGSTGLGLAIARGIAAAHGGTLTVTSVPGRTCFTLQLPPAPRRGGTDAEIGADTGRQGQDAPMPAAPRGRAGIDRG